MKESDIGKEEDDGADLSIPKRLCALYKELACGNVKLL